MWAQSLCKAPKILRFAPSGCHSQYFLCTVALPPYDSVPMDYFLFFSDSLGASERAQFKLALLDFSFKNCNKRVKFAEPIEKKKLFTRITSIGVEATALPKLAIKLDLKLTIEHKNHIRISKNVRSLREMICDVITERLKQVQFTKIVHWQLNRSNDSSCK